MLPPLNSFNAIQVPCLPFPRTFFGRIAYLLSLGTPIEKQDIQIDNQDLDRLEKMGLISISKEQVYPTDFGRMLSQIWKKHT